MGCPITRWLSPGNKFGYVMLMTYDTKLTIQHMCYTKFSIVKIGNLS